MQRRNLGKAMRYLVVVGTLVSAFALVACGDDDDSKDVDVTVPLNVVSVAAVQGVGIGIQGGQIFTGISTGTAVTLVFSIVNANAFTLTGPGGATSTGRVDFFNDSSCTFTVTGPPGGGLQPVGSVTPFSACNLAIQANDVPEDGGLVLGTVILRLTTTGGAAVQSNPLSENVTIGDDGQLFVLNPVTGALAPTGVEP
jgi:hypothetical protein